MVLDRVSEQYSALGNVAGSGVKRVLGKPPLDGLSVVMREAVQNSWDARIRSPEQWQQLRILIRFRNLDQTQRAALQESLTDLPVESEIGQSLAAMLQSPSDIHVMEIADYGTVGLSGPESPQFDTGQSEGTHFVDFIRNIGKEHNDVDGGTYGFGKSSFYALSEVSTVYVDTRSTDANNPVQRLMFAALGNRYTGKVSDADVNFTGRHWWGRSHAYDQVSPVVASEAEGLRAALGLPLRAESETGTTVGVLLPGLPAGIDEPEFINEVRRIVLANFWTKMVPEADGLPAIDFRLEVNGTEFEIPDPGTFSPLAMFVKALEGARSQDTEATTVRAIVTGGNQVHLGHVGYMPSRVTPRLDDLKLGPAENWSDSAGGFLFRDEPSHHYAVMRSGELIVRYFGGRAHANPDLEWAGVFITTKFPDVERAFASSEPPAHDDWNPQGMTGEPGRYVRAGLREVRREFDRFVTPNAPLPDSEVSLGVPAARLGGLLPGLAAADAIKPMRDGKRAAPSGRGSQGRFRPVEFVGYEEHLGQPVLVFTTGWRRGKDSGQLAALLVQPQILLEGRPVSLDEVPAGVERPEVLEMTVDSGVSKVVGSDCAEFDTGDEFTIRVKIGHVRDLAVSMEVKRVQRG